ncbi:MAG: pitrilysin family protein [Acidobacteriota bacterium]
MRICRSYFMLLLALLLLGGSITAIHVVAAEGGTNQPNIALPQGVKRVTSVEGINEYQLSNGLRVLLFPDPSKPTITVNITYLVGSRHEDYGEKGMAHLLEHLMFKGSTKHTNITQELTQHGARPNGTTWFDRTNYFETFQASDENLEWALDLEADRMVNSFIAKKDLDSEMTVVRNEFESGENSPIGVMLERTASAAYVWHNYGRSTIGARSDIENVPIERLQGFYRKYYQPDNAVLTVAGKFDEAKTLNLINKLFGSIPRSPRSLIKTYTAEPIQDGERQVVVRRVGDVQAVCAAYHIPAGSHTDFAAVDILTEVLGDTPSGRLHKALVETKKASAIGGFNYQLREPGLLTFFAEVRQENSLDDARETMLKVVEEIDTNPPTKEEVERARTALLKQIELTLNSSQSVCLTLSEYIGMGDWRLYFLHRDRIKKVSLEDVQRVAAIYLKPSNRTVGMFMPTAKPDRAEIPAVPDVAEMLKDYKGEAVVAAGEVFDASPANIEKRTIKQNLTNGLKFSLLPKKTRGNTVVATLVFHFGDQSSLMNRSMSAQLAGQMLMRGTTKHTRQQIKDEFDRLKARVFVFGGATQASISIETVRDNLPDVIRLAAEVLREPAFPAEEFELLKQEQLAGLESQRSEPQAIGFNAFSRHFNQYPKGDVRYVATFEEEIEEIKATTLDQVKSFYKDFYGVSTAEAVVVGDFDDKQITSLIGELFNSWKSPRPYQRIADSYKEIAAVNKSFETPDKANAMFLAGQVLNIRDDDPDYPALVFGNYMLGGGFLNSRLARRIRQQDGLSYGVGSQLAADSFDKVGRFTAFAIYAPQNAAKLEVAFKEEIEKVLKDGFSAEEITAAKSGFLQSRQVSRAQDRELANRQRSYLFLNRTLTWDEEFENKVQALTPEQILAAMRRHIDPAKITIIKAGDFAKTTK